MTYEPTDVFHYTDAHGFLAITSHKKLWASCIEFLNDEKEFRHCMDLAGVVAQKLHRTMYPHAEKRLATFKDVLGRLWGMYIFSTSFSAQSDLLSQWRGYCGSGNGYNIGFDTEKLKEYCRRHGFLFKPCIYDDEEQENLLRPIVQRLYEGGFDDHSLASLDERISKASDTAAYAVRELAPFMKNTAFREEQEWRLVAYVMHEDPRWKIRPGKTSLIPYIEVDLTNDANAFTHVTIGPGPFNRKSLNFITRVHVMKENLGHVYPVDSAVPYRYW